MAESRAEGARVARNDLTYTAPKARRIKSLAEQEGFQDENGKPDVMRLAAAVGVNADIVKHVLGGEKPIKGRGGNGGR